MRIFQRLALHTVVLATVLAIVLIVVVGWRVRIMRPDIGTSLQTSALVNDLRWSIVGATAIIGLLGVALAGRLARPVSRPMEELRDVARALASGDMSRRPSLMGEGEVGDLADGLRRLAEQLEARVLALQAEESLLAALTDSLNEGVIAVDNRQRVVRMNETARQLLRMREPVPFPAEYLPRDRTLREALASVLSGVESLPGEVRVDDTTLQLTARPLPAGGAILALYDLTPFRRLEAVRRDFVANVSHELRTPLTVIRGFVETLQDAELPVELRQQFLVMVEGNVRRMQRIVDDLLDLSRIESGGWLPNPTVLDINALANEVLAPMLGAAAQKGVALRADVAPNARSIYADPTAARQILSNLAENALRHTVTGEVVVFSAREGDGTWLGVRDTGVGIGAEHVPRIFERFYRADPGRSREAGGTGLGLAIVRHLAETHGGKVMVDSAPGTGTTIAVWLPTNDASAEQLIG